MLKSETPSNNNLIPGVLVSMFPMKCFLWLRLDGPSTCINPFSYLSCYWTKCYTITWLILLGRASWISQCQALVLTFFCSCHLLLCFRIFVEAIGTGLKFYHAWLIKLLFRQRWGMDETSDFFKAWYFCGLLVIQFIPSLWLGSGVHTASLYIFSICEYIALVQES